MIAFERDHSSRRWRLACVYVCMVTSLTLYVQVFGLPWVGGR
jgi:uncharacterized membrane protein YqhA